MDEDEEEDDEDDEEDDEEEVEETFKRPSRQVSKPVLTSKPQAQRQAAPPAARPPAARPPAKQEPVDKFAAELENADLDKELLDPKELGAVPSDEVDFLGMIYEGLVFFDHSGSDWVRGCRRINNFVLRGDSVANFNKGFGKTKNVVRGIGVITKALHEFDPARRWINMPLTKVAAKKIGVVSSKAVDDFYKIYAQWKKEFMGPAMAEVPENLQMAALYDKQFYQNFIASSARWMMSTFNVGEDQAESLVSVSVKYAHLYVEERGASRKPFYEILEPGPVMRPPATIEDLEREQIAKDINLQGTFDVRDDLFTRPNKKRRR